MNTRTASFLPRLVQFLLLLLAGALLARAADSPTVIYSTLRLNGAAFSNVVVQLTPIQLSTMSNSIVAPFTYSNVTRYDGTLTITSVVPQSYRVTLRYSTGITSFTNCFTGLTGTIYASDYICGASPTNGLIAYSTAQADALFALRTNAIRMQTNGVSVAAGYTNLNWSSGVTGYLSGATLVLGVNASGGGGDAGGTNARQFGSLILTNLSGTGALTNAAAFQPASTTLSNLAGTGALTNSAQFVESGSGSASNLNVRSLNGVNSLALTVNTNSLVVTNGRVGIGTNAPARPLDVAGTISAGAGSATQPSYAFNSDTNSGFYSSSDDVLNVTVGGTRSYLWTGTILGANNNSVIGWYSAGFGAFDTGMYRVGAGTNGISSSSAVAPSGSIIASNHIFTGLAHFRTNTVNTPPTAAQIGMGGFIYWNSNGTPWVSRCLDGSTVESKSIF